MKYEKLVAAAKKAKRNAHSPYSGFKVGAAIVTKSGSIYTGCNIEISSFALTLCAERTAVFKAVSEGERRFVAIAIASDGSALTPPCGACRQVLMDLAGNIDVVLSNRPGNQRIMRLLHLFPHPFGARHFVRKKTRTSKSNSRKKK